MSVMRTEMVRAARLSCSVLVAVGEIGAWSQGNASGRSRWRLAAQNNLGGGGFARSTAFARLHAAAGGMGQPLDERGVA